MKQNYFLGIIVYYAFYFISVDLKMYEIDFINEWYPSGIVALFLVFCELSGICAVFTLIGGITIRLCDVFMPARIPESVVAWGLCIYLVDLIDLQPLEVVKSQLVLNGTFYVAHLIGWFIRSKLGLKTLVHTHSGITDE